jgi:hypothetical protein
MNQLQLAIKPLLAGLYLYWQRVSIAWWPAFEHITYVDILPL